MLRRAKLYYLRKRVGKTATKSKKPDRWSDASLRHEKLAYNDGATIVAGVDEAGRGPLAGPVVAAACILPREFRHKSSTTPSNYRTRARRDLR